MKKLIFIMFAILANSCSQRGYEKFQSFDEYSMKGIPPKGKLEYPYVGVKEENDTLSVVIIRRFFYKKKIEYVHKNNYWYNFERYQVPYNKLCQCDTTPIFYHRYIYNDTILTYGFSEYKIPPIDDFLYIRTPLYTIGFNTQWLKSKGYEHTFEELKNYINLYNDSIIDISNAIVGRNSNFYRKKNIETENYIQLRDP